MTEKITQSTHAQHVRAMVHSLAPEADPSGVELMRLIRAAANQYDALIDERLRDAGLSGPRWGLLLRLVAHEHHEGPAGMTPTELSRCQNVSKNTISTLLGSLEAQGLVTRDLDLDDKRVFRIRLTEEGRSLVRATAPAHVSYLNRLVAGLNPEEREQLADLLERLIASMTRATQAYRATRQELLD